MQPSRPLRAKKDDFRTRFHLAAIVLGLSVAMISRAGFINLVQQINYAMSTGGSKDLAIYDAFCSQLEAHYYDRRSLGATWTIKRAAWRRKAAITTNRRELYTVLANLGLTFPVSHVIVVPPADVDQPDVAPRTVKSLHPVLTPQNLYFDPGFRFALVRRGSSLAITVTGIDKGSPADIAGIQPGWYVKGWTMSVTSAQERRFQGVFLDFGKAINVAAMDKGIDATSLDRPAAGIFLAPVEREISFSMRPSTPAAQNPDTVSVQQLPSGIIHVKFDSFGTGESRVNPVDRVLFATTRPGVAGVILDLRDNTGGASSEADRLLGGFLGAGAVLGYEQTAASRRARRSQHISRFKYKGPLAVLVGPGSASSAEVTASALHIHGRAIIVGRATNGSVMYSRLYPLPDGGVVQVPVAAFYDISGKSLEGMGVMPDIEVVPSLGDIRAGRDTAVEVAESALRRGLQK